MGRYLGIERNSRFCSVCNSKEIGGEFHYRFVYIQNVGKCYYQ